MVGASVLGVRLSQIMGSPINQVDAIVSSVSPRHMYGIEAVLMLSLVHGIAVFDQRPLLPADIFHAFQSVRGKALWVTTPLHMRALVRDGSSITSCRGVISSTMPLDKAIAHGIQNASQAQVIEIYGSTETGAIATRVASDIDSWLLLPEVRMRSDSSGVRVLSSHNEQPKKLQDIVQMLSPTSFRLMGRHNDVIKVAGKRASLAGLNQIIQSVSGLEESVLYMPSAGVEDQRPVLIFVGEPLDYRSLKKRLEKKMVSAFIPRTLIRVEKLPVSLSGKIPLSELEKIYKNADMEK